MAENQCASLSRWFSVRPSRISIAFTAFDLTKMLASEAMTPSLTSNVTRWPFEHAESKNNYNKRFSKTNKLQMTRFVKLRPEKVAEADFPTDMDLPDLRVRRHGRGPREEAVGAEDGRSGWDTSAAGAHPLSSA